MAATVTLRVLTGTNAGTESAAQTAIVLVDADALTGGSVAAGTNSFERWMRLKVDVAPTSGVSNFWFQNDGELPDGVTLKFGVTDTPSTPVATASTIATMDLVSGRRYIWDVNTYSEAGDTTRYLVIQEQVAIGADIGAIDQQEPSFGWSET